jgi:hypothetical protein
MNYDLLDSNNMYCYSHLIVDTGVVGPVQVVEEEADGADEEGRDVGPFEVGPELGAGKGRVGTVKGRLVHKVPNHNPSRHNLADDERLNYDKVVTVDGKGQELVNRLP